MTADVLARCIMTEGSIANKFELIALGFTCQRSQNCSCNKNATLAVIQLAKDISGGRIRDPTQGANRWFSPFFMPKEGGKSQCRKPIGSGILDCDGGLEVSCGITKHYKPGWATADKKVTIPGVRDCEYKFFKV